MDRFDQERIARKILFLDETYHVVRQGQGIKNFYQWREKLLFQKVQNSQLIVNEGVGNRGEFYYQKRRELLHAKYPNLRKNRPTFLSVPKNSSKSSLSPPSNNSSGGSPSKNSSPSSHSSSHRSTPDQTPNLSRSSSSTNVLKMEESSSSKVTELYSFTGMHHIFTHHTQSVPVVKFAHDNKDLVGFGSKDGVISICSALVEPTVLRTLKGHQRAVLDIDWSMSNDLVCSSSLDGSLRVWQVKTSKTLRVLTEQITDSTTYCYSCRFYPMNNNIIVTGNNRGKLLVYNISTGKCTQTLNLSSYSITGLEFEPAGNYLFVADSYGYLHIVSFSFATQKFSFLKKVALCEKYCITSLKYKCWSINNTFSPELLVTSHDSCLRIFNLNLQTMEVKPQVGFKVNCKKEMIKSEFCPLIANRDGVCVVSGSEDMIVYIIDVKRKKYINKLQGHSDKVIGVSWNYDESLLASSDASGTVILWKRVKMNSADG